MWVICTCLAWPSLIWPGFSCVLPTCPGDCLPRPSLQLAECRRPWRKGAGNVPCGFLCYLWGGGPALLMTPPPTPAMAGLFPSPQEKRRAERAEQQRIRSEREKERQARVAVSGPAQGLQRPPRPPRSSAPHAPHAVNEAAASGPPSSRLQETHQPRPSPADLFLCGGWRPCQATGLLGELPAPGVMEPRLRSQDLIHSLIHYSLVQQTRSSQPGRALRKLPAQCREHS